MKPLYTVLIVVLLLVGFLFAIPARLEILSSSSDAQEEHYLGRVDVKIYVQNTSFVNSCAIESLIVSYGDNGTTVSGMNYDGIVLSPREKRMLIGFVVFSKEGKPIEISMQSCK